MAKEWIVTDEDLGCDGAYFSHQELVRCKDCRFFEDEDYYGNCYCEEWGNITDANGYCHEAERREDDSK